jgi:transcriptional regulator with XRE-family HTH domain
MDIKNQLKILRENAHLTQEEFAKKIDVGKRTVGSWEQGSRVPDSTQRKTICEFYGITEAELFGGESTGKNIRPDIMEALQDTVAVKALLVTHKNSQDIKNTIKSLLDCIPHLTPEKRQAILALCK